ncbi:uncharacterized protein LOC131658557 [Vicia villosa]|uniref:uncharacterized protein LOC131658557 n=1 Tax=Vicia villosa TaxID=3911 RepID=UPI00273C08CA|nr:uncharacterized protein LOC131658557 [Vicia villosa]
MESLYAYVAATQVGTEEPYMLLCGRLLIPSLFIAFCDLFSTWCRSDSKNKLYSNMLNRWSNLQKIYVEHNVERDVLSTTTGMTYRCLVEMAGRNDAAIATALEAMSQALANQPNADENVGSCSLATYQRENPPVFKESFLRKYYPEDVRGKKEIEFLELKQGNMSGEEISWVVVRREFLRKYYPEDVRGKKEIEFLELKQGNMSVTGYAAKFTELAKFYPYYDGSGAEYSKYIKFENGLRSEIKKAVGYQKIRIFTDLVDSCRSYEEDHNAHYKIVKDKRGKQNRSTPYDALVGTGKAEVANGKRTSGGGARASVVCFKCGEPGHKSDVCTVGEKRCYHCGKTGHVTTDL